MNFTREIKREIVKSMPQTRKGMLALLCGALETGGSFSKGEDVGSQPGFSFTCESEDTAAYLVEIAERLFGVLMVLTGVMPGTRRGRDKLTFSYSGTDSGAFEREILTCSVVKPGQMEVESYLKGAFLGGGSCTLPKEGKKTGYHLEVVFGEAAKAEAYRDLLDHVQLLGNIVTRGGKYVVYTKSREAISDFLAALGASGALKTLEAISAAREENNIENRKENCYAGNADKAAIASAKQTLILEKLRKNGNFSLLDPTLLQTAEARLANPELSLSELAGLMKISKSCLYHRLKRLSEIYRRMEQSGSFES